jgi:hypothetical protein
MASTIAISQVGSNSGAPILVVFGFPGMPAADDIAMVTCPGAGSLPNGITFPANFTGSAGRCLTLPTATATFTLYKIPAGSITATAVGTVTISTAGTFTFSTAGGLGFSLAAGDSLTAGAPGTPDATLADVGWTLAGRW